MALKLIAKNFPEAEYKKGDESITVSLTDEVFALIDDEGSICLWDSIGTDYEEKLAEATKEVDSTKPKKKKRALKIIQTLKENLTGMVAGFDAWDSENTSTLVPYDHTIDPLIPKLRGEATTDRKLKIVTYGSRFLLEPPEGVEEAFDASDLRGKRNKETVKMRGTDPRLQQTVREIPEFADFIKGVVRSVEKNNYGYIGILCRGGRHRSVTTAELLRYVYDDVVIEHLTIER